MDSPGGVEADVKTAGWQFDNTYSRLPKLFFAPATPAKVLRSRLSILNYGLAAELGLNFGELSAHSAAALFAGQDLPDGCRPIARKDGAASSGRSSGGGCP